MTPAYYLFQPTLVSNYNKECIVFAQRVFCRISAKRKNYLPWPCILTEKLEMISVLSQQV